MGFGGSRTLEGSGDPVRKCGHLAPILGAAINSGSASSLLPGRGKPGRGGEPKAPHQITPGAASPHLSPVCDSTGTFPGLTFTPTLQLGRRAVNPAPLIGVPGKVHDRGEGGEGWGKKR